jgi:hypothetical protein
LKKLFILLTILVLGSCREFYDEEFEEFEESNGNRTTTGQGGRGSEDVSYSVELRPTDANVADLSGTAKIDVEDDEVTVDLDVDGIPANIIQLHYSYLQVPCSSLSILIPNNNSTTRSYTVSERTSVDALAEDLRSSGAATVNGDINLTGKTFVVKAFSNFSGLPNPAGTNQLTILCGEITESDNPNTGTGDVFNPPETTTPAPIPAPTGTTNGNPFPLPDETTISF